MYIPNQIRDHAKQNPALYEMATGGGCDYICLSIDRTTDLILCDPEDSGSPGWIDDEGNDYSQPLKSPTVVMLQVSDFDEPHAWNAGGSAILFSGNVTECINYMTTVAMLNNIKSEPDY